MSNSVFLVVVWTSRLVPYSTLHQGEKNKKKVYDILYKGYERNAVNQENLEETHTEKKERKSRFFFFL